MKKLNNKGFAVSTMLYGILAIIIIILMLLLNIMRSSYNKENLITEDLSYYLNKCIAKQVALETCYKTYNADPDNPVSCADEYEAYSACLGIDRTSVVTGKVAALDDITVDLGDAGDTGLIVDTSVTNGTRYIYTGSSPKNHIVIGANAGRIMSIESDGTIRVVFENMISGNVKYDEEGNSTWPNSTLKNELYLKYVDLEYKSIFSSGKFYTGVVYNTYTVKDNLERIRTESDTALYGVPSIEDYVKASSNLGGSCNPASSTTGIEAIGSNCSGSSNWLDTDTCHWTTTNAVVDGSSGYVLTYSNSGVVAKTQSSSCKAAMIMYLKSGTTVDADGTGDASNPFVVDLRTR